MKRFAKVLLVLVLVSAFGYWSYKQLRSSSSLLGKIHVNADSAIKIGVQEIKETLVLDALTSPGYYFDKVSFKDSDDTEKPEKGIDLLPYSVVLYTLPEVKNTLFGTFPISDSEAFEAYTKQELDKMAVPIDDFTEMGYRFAKVDKSKLVLAWNSEKLVVALSPEPRITELQNVFKDILTDGNTIDDSDNPLLEALADSDDHIVYVKDKSKVSLNFEDGKAVVVGDIHTESPNKYQPEITVTVFKNPSFQLYYDANFENQQNESDWLQTLSDISFFKKNNLDAKEILRRTNGHFSLGIEGITTQTDTIITYGYDDNFEKVEERTLQEKQVPKVHMGIGAKNESLKDYLVAQNAVTPNSYFELFPLYQIAVKEGAKQTSFDTFKGGIATQEKSTNSFLKVQIDFPKLQQDIALPMVDKYLENLEGFVLSASQKEGNHISVNGELNSTDTGINILSQFAFRKRQDSVK